ncbi:MAG: hypothetical protein HYT80_00605 [Euryarchaeota archaeon]|nr:hypothetical protein [Euryarchaeota archaeon]
MNRGGRPSGTALVVAWAMMASGCIGASASVPATLATADDGVQPGATQVAERYGGSLPGRVCAPLGQGNCYLVHSTGGVNASRDFKIPAALMPHNLTVRIEWDAQPGGSTELVLRVGALRREAVMIYYRTIQTVRSSSPLVFNASNLGWGATETGLSISVAAPPVRAGAVTAEAQPEGQRFTASLAWHLRVDTRAL